MTEVNGPDAWPKTIRGGEPGPPPSILRLFLRLEAAAARRGNVGGDNIFFLCLSLVILKRK